MKIVDGRQLGQLSQVSLSYKTWLQSHTLSHCKKKVLQKVRQRVRKALELGSHLWTKNVNADDAMVIGVLLQNSPVRAGIFIFTSHRTDGALVQLLWHFNEHLNHALAHYTVSSRAKTVLFILFTPAKIFLSLLYVSDCDYFSLH